MSLEPTHSNRRLRKNRARTAAVALFAAALITQLIDGAWSATASTPAPDDARSCDDSSWQVTLDAVLQCLPLLSQKPAPRIGQYARCIVALFGLLPEQCEERL